jgi:hypothetical protein
MASLASSKETQLPLFDETLAPLPEKDERATRQSDRRGGKEALPLEESSREAERLMYEGVQLRYANSLRRRASPAALPPPRQPEDLVPTYLEQWPEGWQCTIHGFVVHLMRSDAKTVAKLINAHKEELGVFSCKREPDGKYVFMVDF